MTNSNKETTKSKGGDIFFFFLGGGGGDFFLSKSNFGLKQILNSLGGKSKKFGPKLFWVLVLIKKIIFVEF